MRRSEGSARPEAPYLTQLRNSAGGIISGRWPYILLCENSCTENTDGYTVRVVVDRTDHCHCAGACAGILDEGGGDRNIRNSTIYIEDPPIDESGRRRWTDDPDLNGKIVDDNLGAVVVRWLYLPTAVLHEMGHVVGLLDLYGIPGFFLPYGPRRHRDDNACTIPRHPIPQPHILEIRTQIARGTSHAYTDPDNSVGVGDRLQHNRTGGGVRRGLRGTSG